MNSNFRVVALAAIVALAACTPALVSREQAPDVEQVSPTSPAARAEDLREIVVTACTSRGVAGRGGHADDACHCADGQRDACSGSVPRALDREIYGKVDANPVHRAPRIRSRRSPSTSTPAPTQRAPLPERRPAAAAGRGARRGDDQLLRLRVRRAARRATPFRVATELAPTPWNPQTAAAADRHQGLEAARAERPPANLVFLIDVSGSMQQPDKLPLLKTSLRLLARRARRPRDRVVDGRLRRQLRRRAGADARRPEARRSAQRSIGSKPAARPTAPQASRSPMRWRDEGFVKGGINRVVLATDGDFNVGTATSRRSSTWSSEKRKSGVALTTLGFGTGNYNDQLLERLADAGNGNYAYVDTLTEARKVLVSELVADAAHDREGREDPGRVQSGAGRRVPPDRLREPPAAPRGLQQRQGRRRRDRRRPLGHRALRDRARSAAATASIRCATVQRPASVKGGDELAFVRLRYKQPADGMQASSRLIEQPVEVRAMREDAGAASAAVPPGRGGRGLRPVAARRHVHGRVSATATSSRSPESADGVDPEARDFLRARAPRGRAVDRTCAGRARPGRDGRAQ